MRKLLLALTLFVCLQAGAQITEGKIVYSMKFDGMGSEKDNPLLGNTSTSITFKKDRSLTETATPVFQMKTLITGNDMLMLMDGMNMKTFYHTNKTEVEKNAGKNMAEPTVTVTKEKKKILGFDCTKVIVQGPGGKTGVAQIIVWITDKIHTNAELAGMNSKMMTKMNGTPLEMNTNMGPIKSTVTATSISLKPVPDAVFNLSTKGYTETKNPGMAMH